MNFQKKMKAQRFKNILKWMGPKKKETSPKEKKKASREKVFSIHPLSCTSDGTFPIGECTCSYCRRKREQNGKKRDMSRYQKYRAFLEKKGFVQLGSGAYSVVYAKPKSDRVIKVIRTRDNWIDYAVWANKEGYGGNLAPKVYSYKDHEDFAVAVVERMKTTLSGYREHDEQIVIGLVHSYVYNNNVLAGVLAHEIAPGISDFLVGVKKNVNGRLDLHGGNFMLREDGSLCVTDPVAGEGSATYTRLKVGDFTPTVCYYLGRIRRS